MHLVLEWRAEIARHACNTDEVPAVRWNAPEKLTAKAVTETDTDGVSKRIDSPEPEEECRKGIGPYRLGAKEAGPLNADRFGAEAKAPERTAFSLERRQ
jgi:hypothetical protein